MTFVIDFVIESLAIYLSKSNRRNSNTYLSSYHIGSIYIPRIRFIATDNHYVSLRILQDLIHRHSLVLTKSHPIYFSMIINVTSIIIIYILEHDKIFNFLMKIIVKTYRKYLNIKFENIIQPIHHRTIFFNFQIYT